MKRNCQTCFWIYHMNTDQRDKFAKRMDVFCTNTNSDKYCQRVGVTDGCSEWEDKEVTND